MNAVEMWTLTAHLKATIRNNFRNLCDVPSHISDKSFSRKTMLDQGESIQKSIIRS